MTTDTVRVGPAAASLGTGHASFRRLLLAEWTKLRTVRSTIWSLVALVIIALGFTVLLSTLTAHYWAQATPTQRATTLGDPVNSILGGGLGLGQLAICVLGVLVTAGEYSTGMIRSTLLAAPRRLRPLAAKCVVFTVIVLIIGEVMGVSCFFIGRAILSSHVQVSLSDPGVTRAVLGFGLYLGMVGLYSIAIGQLIRHVAGSVCTVLGTVLVLPLLASTIPGTFGKHLNAYLPTNAGSLILTAGQPKSGQLLTAWEGYGVFALWVAVLLAFAGWLLVKRDA